MSPICAVRPCTKQQQKSQYFFWGIAKFVVLFFKTALARCEKKKEAIETYLIPDMMMEEGHQETLPPKWVESVFFMVPVSTNGW